MIKPFFPFALLLAAISAPPVIAQDDASQAKPQLSLEQTTAIRCSAAFAIVTMRQAQGDANALAYPPLTDRGREFFVRSSARIMDENKISREAVAALLQAEAQKLSEGDAVDQIMPSCLLLLEASGL